MAENRNEHGNFSSHNQHGASDGRGKSGKRRNLVNQRKGESILDRAVALVACMALAMLLVPALAYAQADDGLGGLAADNAQKLTSQKTSGVTTAPCVVVVLANPDAGGTVTGGGPYVKGLPVTVEATAADGYAFVNWTSGGAVVSTDAKYTFEAEGDTVALAANFAQLYGIECTSTEDGKYGSVNANKNEAAAGDIVMLTVEPKEGCDLDRLEVLQGREKVDCKKVDDKTYTFAMPVGPVTVSAYFFEPYPLWVGSVQVTSANKHAVVGKGISGKISYEGDAAGGTLTMDGATVTSAHEFDSDGDTKTASIYTGGSNFRLTISLSGESATDGANYGVYGSGLIQIEGAGKLSAAGTDCGVYGGGEYSKLNVNGAELTASGGSAGIHVVYLSVDKGTVTASSTGTWGIFTNNGADILNSTVEATCGAGGYGIYAERIGFEIEGSTVMAKGGKYGICSMADYTRFKDSTVTAEGTGCGIVSFGFNDSVTIADTGGTTKVDTTGGSDEGAMNVPNGELVLTSVGITQPVGGTSDGKCVRDAKGAIATHVVIESVPNDSDSHGDLKANPMTVAAKKVTFFASDVKKADQSVKASKAFTVKKAQGKVTYKVSKYVTKKAKGKVLVAKNGKVTVKKGTPKGAYQLKVKVTAAGNAKYAEKSKKVTLSVTVK